GERTREAARGGRCGNSQGLAGSSLHFRLLSSNDASCTWVGENASPDAAPPKWYVLSNAIRQIAVTWATQSHGGRHGLRRRLSHVQTQQRGDRTQPGGEVERHVVVAVAVAQPARAGGGYGGPQLVGREHPPEDHGGPRAEVIAGEADRPRRRGDPVQPVEGDEHPGARFGVRRE